MIDLRPNKCGCEPVAEVSKVTVRMLKFSHCLYHCEKMGVELAKERFISSGQQSSCFIFLRNETDEYTG